MSNGVLNPTGVSKITFVANDAEAARKFLAALTTKEITDLITDDCEIQITFNGSSNEQ